MKATDIYARRVSGSGTVTTTDILVATSPADQRNLMITSTLFITGTNDWVAQAAFD